jgi:hypothetical protein
MGAQTEPDHFVKENQESKSKQRQHTPEPKNQTTMRWGGIEMDWIAGKVTVPDLGSASLLCDFHETRNSICSPADSLPLLDKSNVFIKVTQLYSNYSHCSHNHTKRWWCLRDFGNFKSPCHYWLWRLQRTAGSSRSCRFQNSGIIDGWELSYAFEKAFI